MLLLLSRRLLLVRHLPASSPRLLHGLSGAKGAFGSPEVTGSDTVPSDGVTAETRRLRRLGVGGVGGANAEAVDVAVAAGASRQPCPSSTRAAACL